MDAVVGTYEFPSGAKVTVRRDRQQLRTTITGSGGIFFAASGNTLVPVGPREFLIEGPRKDHVLFSPNAARSAAMTLNPGQWEQRAKKIQR